MTCHVGTMRALLYSLLVLVLCVSLAPEPSGVPRSARELGRVQRPWDVAASPATVTEEEGDPDRNRGGLQGTRPRAGRQLGGPASRGPSEEGSFQRSFQRTATTACIYIVLEKTE
eukprot:7351877-Pyramimonas_sp.AAC.1